MKPSAMMAGLAGAALAFAFSATSRAEPLAEAERAYVVFTTWSFAIGTLCDGFEAVEGYATEFADKRGVDSEKIGAAVLNTIMANASAAYDRTALMPEVTRLVRTSMDTLAKDFARSKKVACEDYGKTMIGVGFLRRKGR